MKKNSWSENSGVAPHFCKNNGNYNRENLKKTKKNPFCGSKMRIHELIFHPHIEERYNNIFCYMKKIILIKKKIRKMSFRILALTMAPHCNGKNHKSQISQFFLYQYDFIYKAEYISILLLYMWVEDELMNTHFTATKWIF